MIPSRDCVVLQCNESVLYIVNGKKSIPTMGTITESAIEDVIRSFLVTFGFIPSRYTWVEEKDTQFEDIGIP